MLGSTAKALPMIDKLTPSAKIVDGILIITLPDAIRPVVWQMELGQTKSSGMEVREMNDGTFVLTLKTPRQDVQDIAPYATRDQAVRALMAISRALEGSGRLRHLTPEGVNMNTPYHVPALIPTASGSGKTLRVVFGILVLLGLLYVFTRPLPNAPEGSGPAMSGASTSGPAGEPLSADDYLNAP